MTNEDIENSVLCSFLLANEMGEDTEKAFLLSEDAFTSSFRKRIATKINATTSTDKAYALLSYDLENSVTGTIYEQDWVNIIGSRTITGQTPLPLTLAKRYHDDIRKEYEIRLIRGSI